MKKICILSVCALVSLGALAQETVLKEAKKAIGKQSYTEVVKMLTPAMSDPATANNPETYFLAGKAGMEYYKKLETKARAEGNGQMTDADGLQASQALLGGYDYLQKAIELDANSPKPKYAKDAVKLLNENYNGFNNAGVYFFNNKDYANAYRCWDIYLNLPQTPLFADNKLMNALITPETRIDLLYNKGIAAYSAEMYNEALESLKASIAAGNDSKTTYDYALYSAINMNDPEKIRETAIMCYEKFGKDDPQYIGQIINGYLSEKNYSEALSMIDKAIANFPETSQYYFIKGYLLEQPEVKGDCMEWYQKAVDLDPTNDSALYQMGYYTLSQADEISNNAPSDDQYNKIKAEQIDPLLQKGIDYLRQAYKVKLDKEADLHDTEVLLKNAYYLLGKDYNTEMKDLLY